MVWVILLLSLCAWFAADWEWRVPAGVQSRIVKLQNRLSAPACAYHCSWPDGERPEEMMRRFKQELIAAQKVLGVPLFLVIMVTDGFKQAYIKPLALIERRFHAAVIHEAEPFVSCTAAPHTTYIDSDKKAEKG